MKKLIGFAFVFFLGLVTLRADPLPEPAEGKYVKTLGGGFAIRLAEDRETVESCKYSVILAPSQNLEHPLYLKVWFENPLNSKESLTAELVLKPGMKDILATSSEVHGLKGGKNYKMTIAVYDSESHTNKLEEYVQPIHSGRDIN